MYWMKHYLVVVMVILGLSGTCAHASPDSRFTAALADIKGMVAAAPDEWGLSVSVTDRNDMLMVAMHGYADIERKVPVTAGTRFAIGSISKSFAAFTLMQMADEGRFDPAAPISQYLPDFHPQSGFPPITGHSLLSHTSGLPDYLSDVASTRFLIAKLNDFEPSYAPGTHFWYSNTGYQLLGYAAEQIDGVPYPLILQRRVLDRLGMTETAPQIDDRLLGHMGKSYVRSPAGNWREAPWFPYLASDGAIVSTAGDMGRYARMLLARGALPSGRVVSAVTFDRIATPVQDGYGYGFDVLDQGRVLTHSGSIAGFQAYLNADLGHGFAVVFLSNGPIDKVLRDRIIARLTEAAGGQPREVTAPLPPFDNASSFDGGFQGIAGNSLVFETSGQDGLTLNENASPLPLTRLGKDTWGAYLTPRGPRTFIFFRDSSGVIAGVSEGTATFAKRGPPPDAPDDWCPLAGRYMAHGEEGPGVRIFARNGTLMMAYTDSNAPAIALTQEGPGRFRFAEPDWAPERLVFDTNLDGHDQRLTLSGVALYRIDLP
jgi:D-alanyl-D-alanine carboxypeptidase